MKKISEHEVLLDDDSKVILVDMLARTDIPAAEIANNIYRISSTGERLWQIQGGESQPDPVPFTGLGIDEHGGLRAFRWDGDLFAVDVDTGKAEFLRFVK